MPADLVLSPRCCDRLAQPPIPARSRRQRQEGKGSKSWAQLSQFRPPGPSRITAFLLFGQTFISISSLLRLCANLCLNQGAPCLSKLQTDWSCKQLDKICGFQVRKKEWMSRAVVLLPSSVVPSYHVWQGPSINIDELTSFLRVLLTDPQPNCCHLTALCRRPKVPELLQAIPEVLSRCPVSPAASRVQGQGTPVLGWKLEGLRPHMLVCSATLSSARVA